MRARAYPSSQPAKVSAALLLRAVEYGEADVIVTVLTELEGKVALMARGARKGGKRIGGALEPFHGIEVRYEDRRGEVGVLKESRVIRVRTALAASLERMDAAGTALRWARHLCPPRTPEPGAWSALGGLLDGLDSGGPILPALATAGLRLLGAVGYSLDFERCVRCGKRCPEGRAGVFDSSRGGLVCRACLEVGQAASASSERWARPLASVPSSVRSAAVGVMRGETAAPEHAQALLAIVERAMAVHTEYEG